jgi:hypothetical protein
LAEDYEGEWLSEEPVPELRLPEARMSPDELFEKLRLNDKAEAGRKDSLMNFPEISVYTGWNFRKEKVVTGIGVELFHNQNRPRKHRWKTQLILGEDSAGLSIGKIIVPVVNFEVGPGYDFINKAWLLKMSWYKF